MKRCLITGSSGFVGRHFVRRLADDGYDVDAIDIVGPDPLDCLGYFHEFTDHPPDLVIHCAAVVGGRKGISGDALRLGAENLSLDGALFKWALKARPGRIVYFSSSAAYPMFRQTKMWHRANEQDRLSEHMIWEGGGFGPEIDPDSTYGWSKIAGEVLAREANAEGIPTFVFRPFSGYGADQDPSYPFRAILDRVRALEPDHPLELWCGDCVRDWIHVDDLVQGALAVARDGTEEPVNLCTGRLVSFVQLAVLMLAAAGKDNHGILARPDMPQGVAYRVGDPRRMLMYYEPKISLEEGIRRALD